MAFKQLSSRQVDFLESGLSGDDAAPEVRPSSFSAKRMLAVGAGLLGLAGCAGAAVFARAPSDQGMKPVEGISARALLEDPDFLDVASNNVWTLGQQHMQGKEHKLKPAVRRMMSSLSQIIAEHDPEGSQHLDKIRLSKEQKDDVVAVVKRMGDRRVQSVGKDVLEIALKHKDDKNTDGLEKELKSVFTPRREELQALKESVLPKSLRDKAEAAVSSEEVQSRRLGTSTTSNPGGMLTNAMGSDMSMKLEDALAVIGGLAEQARLALDESSTIGTSFGTVSHHVPWYWRSLVGGLAFGTETMDCMLRQDDQHETKKDGTTVLKSGNSGQVNSVKMAMCPMKYAGAGMDFMSGVNNMMGIQNSKLPYDFQMMFGGAPQAGYNPYGAAPARAATNPLSMFAPHPATQPVHPMQQMMNHAMNAMAPRTNTMNTMAHPAAYGQTAYHPAMQQHPGFAYPR
eukprot:TRINITY_DN271_c0_g1_i8.p1 TRINITY_DN271_c0_g1~~TRINITY_DN271_c0_g1_i8.p1  ORF type:complete len:484 (+),score=120.84 TRINITY_DN271_c0_g1_i8:86-1453(+)